jgi:hypothetical protein
VEQGGRPLQKENAAASDNTPSEPCGAATQELACAPKPKSDQGANSSASAWTAALPSYPSSWKPKLDDTAATRLIVQLHSRVEQCTAAARAALSIPDAAGAAAP